MCPNTTALGIKLKRKFKNNEIVSNYFRKIGINKNYLWVFYITFDIPSMISQSIFQNNLKELKKAVDELSNTNT